MPLAFIPQPQQLEELGGFLAIPRTGFIGIADHSLYPVAQEAQAIFRRHPIAISPRTTRDADSPDTLSISRRDDLKPGGYRLAIRNDRLAIRSDSAASPAFVVIEAQSVAAAFHALQTLRQIVAQSPAGKLPLLSIHDWPDFEARGLYYDVCRGRVPKLESLMAQADLLARHKINQLQYYIEHTFRFRAHPEIGKNASPLTPEDILLMDAYCRERHVELVPSLASFGHMQNVLTLAPYRELAEDWGEMKYVNPEAEKMPQWQRLVGWTLSPANPKTYEFLDSLFAEFLPLFSSDKFNVCCDETFDLGMGQTYELCKKKGKGRVYLDHILRLNALCQRYGKKMMFWGDIIHHYPELISEIPKDVTVLDWGYNYNHPFEAIEDFQKAGLDSYACPGTNSWGGLFPRLHEAQENIARFAAAGRKFAAKGLLNTDWGDGGHYNLMEFSWHGYLFGAEQAWNAKADHATFTARFCKLFLGINAKELVAAINELGEIAAWLGCRWIGDGVLLARADNPVFTQPEVSYVAKGGVIRKATLDAAQGRRALKSLERIRKTLQRAAAKPKADPQRILTYWLFAVETLATAALKLRVLGKGGKDSPAGRRVIKRRTAELMKRFEQLWRASNRPSEIRITLQRFREAIRSLAV